MSSATQIKYLEALDSALTFSGPEAKNIFEYCNERGPVDHFIGLTSVGVFSMNSYQRQVIVRILHNLVAYARSANLPYKCDMRIVIPNTLYCYDRATHEASLKMLLYDAERTEDNEPATEYTLLEKALSDYRLFNDESNAFKKNQLPVKHHNIKKFVDTFQRYENFVTCDKLFEILHNNVADKPAMCLVITEVIKYVAPQMAKDRLRPQLYVNLLNKIIRSMEIVKSHPQILHLLINTVDVGDVKKDDRFQGHISSIENAVIEAFTFNVEYGTALELFGILKRCGIADNKLYAFVIDLTSKSVDGSGNRQFPILFLALDATFEVFRNILPASGWRLYNHFKKQFLEAVDIELKSIYVALIVTVLAGYKLAPGVIPEMPSNIIESEATIYYKFISEHVVNITNGLFTRMMFGMALFVYYASFNTPRELVTTQAAFYTLSIALDGYSQSFEWEATQNQTMDFQLLKQYCSCATKLYDKDGNNVAFANYLFEVYNFADIWMFESIEEFILKVFGYEENTQQYKLFADVVFDIVRSFAPVVYVMSTVRKVFTLIRRSRGPEFDLSIAAAKFFQLNLSLLTNQCERHLIVFDVQEYLYTTHITSNSCREELLDLIQQKIDYSGNHKMFEELLKKLQSSGKMNDNRKRKNPTEVPELPQPLQSSGKMNDNRKRKNPTVAPPPKRRHTEPGSDFLSVLSNVIFLLLFLSICRH